MCVCVEMRSVKTLSYLDKVTKKIKCKYVIICPVHLIQTLYEKYMQTGCSDLSQET